MPRVARRPHASYFPAQKSELHFLIEPSIIPGPAIRCSHRRIDELCKGDVARSTEELWELFWSLEQSSLRVVEGILKAHRSRLSWE
jgi:hypothetical protein